MTTTQAACDFCNTSVAFRVERIGPGPFTSLEPVVPGSGSDHLATWCSECGSAHRSS